MDDDKSVYIRSAYCSARYIAGRYKYFQQKVNFCPCIYKGESYCVQKIAKECIALAHAGGMGLSSKIVFSCLMFNRTGNLAEQFARKEVDCTPEPQTNDLAEVTDPVSGKEEVGAEV